MNKFRYWGTANSAPYDHGSYLNIIFTESPVKFV